MLLKITFEVDVPRYSAAVYGYGKDKDGNYPKLNNVHEASKWLRGAGQQHMLAALDTQLVYPQIYEVLEEDIHVGGHGPEED